MLSIAIKLQNCLINGELIQEDMEKIQDIAEFVEILMDLLENMDQIFVENALEKDLIFQDLNKRNK